MKKINTVSQYVVVLFLISSNYLAKAQTISTYAGGGPLDNNILAINAELYANDVAFDGSGNLFIVDLVNNCVRKVDHATGIITVVAGNGMPGYLGDNGLATNSQLNDPNKIAFDASYNLYISDNNNYRVRRVDQATGIITTIAGNGTSGFSGDNGLAINAQLSSALGIAFDSFGNLFIADGSNNRIRKVDLSSGIITTVAGNGTYGFFGDSGQATAAELAFPVGVSFDSMGNMYISDAGNQRIRKVDFITGIITTVVGNGNFGFSGDGGQAINAGLELVISGKVIFDGNGDLYFPDDISYRIRKVDHTTGVITTVAGNGDDNISGDNDQAINAGVGFATGIVFDATGNLHIADGYVRKVDNASGIITTEAGNGMVSFSGDNGQATIARLSSPTDVVIDNYGNLYINDHGNDRIRMVDHATGIITTVVTANDITGNGNSSGPSAIALDGLGNLYISDANGNLVRKVDLATGVAVVAVGTGTQGDSGDNGLAIDAELDGPGSLVFDASGNLYIAETYNNHVIRKVDHTTGIITTIAGHGNGYTSSGDGGLAIDAQLYPSGMAIDSSGNLFIADIFNNRIRKVDQVTGIITTVAGNGNPGFLGDGDLATNAELMSPNRLAFDSYGNLYIATGNNIRKIDHETGIITTVVGNGNLGFSGDGFIAVNAELNSTFGIAFNSNNAMFIADNLNNRIRKVTATQAIAFSALPSKTYGDPTFSLSATASSGLTVTYTSSDPTVATISGNTITIVGAGTTTITCSQTGNSDFDPASNIPQILTINKSSQQITFSALASKTYGDAPFSLNAIASSGLTVTYTSSDQTVATINGNAVTIIGAGETTIIAKQAGNSNFDSAAYIPQILTINKSPQQIAFSALDSKTYGDSPFSLNAAANSGLAVTYTSSDPKVAAVTGNTVTIVGVGAIIITASQVGDKNFYAAPDATQNLLISPITGIDKKIATVFYPNPATGEIYYVTPTNEPVSVQIIDLLGRVLKQEEFSAGGELRIELNGLSSGSYFLKAIQGSNSKTIHFINK